MRLVQLKLLKVPNINSRTLHQSDCEIISLAFKEQGWHKPVKQYLDYLNEQNSGIRLVILGFIDNCFAGYLTILWDSDYLYFLEKQIPEIMDLNVLIKYQRHRVGTKLMDHAERLILETSGYIGIGVGVTQDYGKAQRMYIQRGYVPDGNGLIQNNRALLYGDTIMVDHHLTLYLVKARNK